MKKKLSVGLALVLSLSVFTACGNKDKKEEVKEETKEVQEVVEDKKEENTEVEAGMEFIEEDGKLVYLETENIPVEAPALKVIVDKDAKIVEFLPAEADGTTGADFFKFNLETNEFEKYYYVSMMGTGHYYYYDLANNELLRVEDNDHADVSESTKESGRWDGAVEKIEGEKESLENYFKEANKKTIEEFIAE